MLIDIVLIAILSLFIFIGWKRGLVMSVFLLGSTIVAIFLASVFSPVVATGLEKMGLPEKIAPTFSSYAEDAINEKLEEKATIKTEISERSAPLFVRRLSFSSVKSLFIPAKNPFFAPLFLLSILFSSPAE